jgi:predicted RNA-binding Zn-ribbon protein involved in translation (DUF1610 family)
MKSSEQNPGCLATVLSWFGIKLGAPGGTTFQQSRVDQLPYRVRDDFLSPAERSFYQVLNTAIGNRAIVCPKVNLIDVFFVVRPNENASYRGRIAQKHVDFLVCQPGTMRPLVGVELDDSSHSRPDRQMRDEFIDQVFEAAGLPLVRFSARSGYNPNEIAERLVQYIDMPASAPQPARSSRPASSSLAPLCPKCGVPMVIRTVKSGEHQGKQFYGCPNYPQCRQVLPMGH